MTEADDIQLLRDFTERQSDAAFAALVTRHVNLVYSVALRQMGNPHAAEEITQAVFIILARKAGSIGPKTILSGWLYQTARLTATNLLRTERRRAFREQEAYMHLALVNGVLRGMEWAKVKVVAATSLGVLVSAAVIYLSVPKAETEKPASAVSQTNRPLRTVATRVEQPARQPPATNYVLAAIGTMPGFVSTHVTSVNNHGQVVGWMDGSNGIVHAFFWEHGNAIDLGTFGGSKAIASGINDLGEIVAVVLTNEQRRVFMLQASNVTDLGAIDSFAKLGTDGNISYTPSVYINNLSQITGRLMVKDDNQRSFLFGQGQISYFGLRGDGSICYAKAMNNRGQIAGQSIQRNNRWGVFLWQNGEITDLKILGGPRASVNAINDHGTVVGWANPAGATWDQAHAIVWEKGELFDLNAAGWKTSRAASINNAGEVVGYATTTNNRSFAFLKRGDEILDLNDLVVTNSGWHLFDADEINERGQILARGRKGRQLDTFLVSPSRLSPASPAKPSIASALIANSTTAASHLNLSSFEQLPSGAFRLVFTCQPDLRYAIEASTNLTTWTLLGEATNNNGQVEFVDQDAPKFALRFYRIVSP